jgi:hypothetical protein
MTNARSIQGIIVLILATFAAIWLGISIATDQTETILQVSAVIVFIICLSLGRKVWLLIPFMAALGLQLRIPGQPSSLLVGQAIAFGFSTMLFLMRKLPFKVAITELELWMIAISLCVLQVYLRNPVSLNLFGGSMVGGKGYILYTAALVSAIQLSVLIVPVSDLRWILRVSIVGGILGSMLSILGNFIPALGYMLGSSYQRGDELNYDNDNAIVDPGAATRVSSLSNLSSNLSLWISSYISPLRALIRPLWALLIIVAVSASLLSGFRNSVATVGLTFLIGIAYRSGITGLILSSLTACGALALLAVVNVITPLPPNIQRALTFLPGTWEERYKLDAEASSEWRFEIWREVLLTDRWIQNKWLGDGLGFSARDLAAQINERKGTRAGISGFDSQREAILASGEYHSGPVATIRVIGYIGLILFLAAQIRLAVHAHRQILRCRGTEWLPLALFIGIPMVYGPLFFVFIFGDFKTNGVLFLLAAGMIRLLENNLPLPAWIKATRIPQKITSPQPEEGPTPFRRSAFKP